MPKKSTSTEFLLKARRVHGAKYDYSVTRYVNARTKVQIVCPEHGIFQQFPGIHLFGHGCPKCGREITGTKLVGKRNLTTDQFVTRAVETHGHLYDYSVTEYVNAKTKVRIRCTLHGEFLQNPDSHLRGCRCPECGNHSRSVKHSLTTPEFIRLSRERHGDRYDYSESRYVAAVVPVTIICREHGPFEMLPYAHHWNGSGCSECSKIRVAESNRMSIEEFIVQARAVHGDRYSYEKVRYTNSSTDVTIICPLHGDFDQRPANHLCTGQTDALGVPGLSWLRRKPNFGTSPDSFTFLECDQRQNVRSSSR